MKNKLPSSQAPKLPSSTRRAAPGSLLYYLLLMASIGCGNQIAGVSTDGPSANNIAHSSSNLVGMLRGTPLKVGFDIITVDLSCDREELSRYISLISTPGPSESMSLSRSRRLHVGRLLVISGESPEWIVKRIPVSADIADHVKLGEQDFVVTWRGLEAVALANREPSEHRDQTLCALGELGIGLDSTIDTAAGAVPVAGLLAASIGEFHLDQKEISWTASAYASYLPPQTVWWNRYEEEFSFDTLVLEMMARKLNRESCRGLHIVMALTKILKIDRDSNILGPDSRKLVNVYLRCKLAEAVGSQLEDGSWPMLWSVSGFSDVLEYTPEGTDLNRVMVTGHMLEWFHALPKDLKPPTEVVLRGSGWLLENLRSVSRETINKEFCSYTHAVLSLFLALILK